MLTITRSLALPEQELVESFVRASGPGPKRQQGGDGGAVAIRRTQLAIACGTSAGAAAEGGRQSRVGGRGPYH